MYHIISVLSLLIRQFYLPNPFECFGDIGVFYNWCAGIILAPLSYALVGLVSKRFSTSGWQSAIPVSILGTYCNSVAPRTFFVQQMGHCGNDCNHNYGNCSDQQSPKHFYLLKSNL